MCRAPACAALCVCVCVCHCVPRDLDSQEPFRLKPCPLPYPAPRRTCAPRRRRPSSCLALLPFRDSLSMACPRVEEVPSILPRCLCMPRVRGVSAFAALSPQCSSLALRHILQLTEVQARRRDASKGGGGGLPCESCGGACVSRCSLRVGDGCAQRGWRVAPVAGCPTWHPCGGAGRGRPVRVREGRSTRGHFARGADRPWRLVGNQSTPSAGQATSQAPASLRRNISTGALVGTVVDHLMVGRFEDRYGKYGRACDHEATASILEGARSFEGCLNERWVLVAED